MPGGRLASQEDVERLERRIRALEDKQGPTQVAAFAGRNRRFRLASANLTALVSLNGTVTVNVTFNQSMATLDYQVDVTVPVLLGQAVTNISVSNRGMNGCTVQFTTPAVLAIGTTVIVLALSGPQN